MLSELLLRQLAVTLHARALTSPQVRPTDEPVVRSGSAEAIRVLVLGSGITSGWGVHTHGLALVGWLQKTLQERLNRSVDVEQIGATGVTLAGAVELLGARATEQWDAIVVAFGLSDVMRLTPTREWAQALDRLLAKLDGDMPQGLLVPIVLVGMPPTESIGLMTPLRSIFRRQPERLNLLTEDAVERNRRTVFAPLPAMANSSASPQGSSEAYRVWAGAIAELVVPRIPPEVVRMGETDVAAAPLARLTAAALDVRNTGVRASLMTIAGRLRDETDVDLVSIGLLSGDRMWSVADSTGRADRSLLLPASFFDTVSREGLMHVRDTTDDVRFAHLSVALASQFDSYAGVALRDATGRMVGAVCLFNGAAGTGLDEPMLQRAGMEIESQLALLRDEGPVFVPGDGVRPEPPAASQAGAIGAPSDRPAARETPVEPQEVAPPMPGRLRRRVRLSTEGRQLAGTGSRRAMPTGRDLRIQGPDPIRVLMAGGEYSVGFGTTDRHDALDGAVARLLHVRTGRGVIVENRSRHEVPLEQLASSLGPAGAHTFDLVIWTPTFVEAARLLLRSRWIAGIGLMLRRIQTTSNAAVLLVGFPTLLGAQPLAAIGRSRAAQINRLLAGVAARHQRVSVVQPPAIVLRDVETVSGAEVYHAAAVQILPAVMRLLGSEEPDRDATDDPHPASHQLDDLVLA